MDTLSHAAIGALVLRVPGPGFYANWVCTERLRLAAVAAASIFPDLDYVTFPIDPYRFITEWHRGISHSLLLLPLWAVFLGLFIAALVGRSTARRELIWLSALGLLLHNLFDLITVYGTQIFAPWSDLRIALGWTFDADIWIAAIAASSLLLSFYRRFFARYGLILIGLYLGLAVATQIAALEIAQNQFRISIHRIYAIAHPLSPFHRHLLVETPAGYWQAWLDLSGTGIDLADSAAWTKIGLGRYRNENFLQWNWRPKPGASFAGWQTVRDAWQQPRMRGFRRFAVLPMVYRIDLRRFRLCVWFTDLRYVLPAIDAPFRYGMCRQTQNSEWHGYRLKRFTRSERESIE